MAEKPFPAFPEHAQHAILCIWQRAHVVWTTRGATGDDNISIMIILFFQSEVDDIKIENPTEFMFEWITSLYIWLNFSISDSYWKRSGRCKYYCNVILATRAVCPDGADACVQETGASNIISNRSINHLHPATCGRLKVHCKNLIPHFVTSNQI